ncbi:hypothetical protein PoB_000432400 [Plakobranchus ocellatus]|uniref:Uncharacterized protein n=1 Tax=Plakobranchus ocellatus TaxID=259542 RepID=A0AAV3Y4D3_9GAST|nr:hypothetical protein PoB_000432400 [Plakobranchus ocellatus]
MSERSSGQDQAKHDHTDMMVMRDVQRRATDLHATQRTTENQLSRTPHMQNCVQTYQLLRFTAPGTQPGEIEGGQGIAGATVLKRTPSINR